MKATHGVTELQPPSTEDGRPTSAARPLLAGLRRLARNDLGPVAVVLALALIWLYFQSQNSEFMSARNLSNLAQQIGVIGILAIGVVMVLIVGEIDLSVGSVAGASAALLGVLLSEHSWPAWAAIATVMAFGLGVGLIQGLIVVLVGVPSFIVTLGGYLTFLGVQLALIGNAGEIRISDPAVLAIANNYLSNPVSWIGVAVVALVLAGLEVARRRDWLSAGQAVPPAWRGILHVVAPTAGLALLVAYFNRYLGVPYLIVILLALIVVMSWITRRTIYGRHIYAIGGNSEGARRAGVSVGPVRLSVLGLSGAFAALAGIVSASQLYAVDSNTGGGTLLLSAVAAAIIGGTSLFGGRGRMSHALLGALVIESVANGLALLGQSAATQNIATGIILVLAVSIDAINRRRRLQRG